VLVARSQKAGQCQHADYKCILAKITSLHRLASCGAPERALQGAEIKILQIPSDYKYPLKYTPVLGWIGVDRMRPGTPRF
jgi:hypothetical protein